MSVRGDTDGREGVTRGCSTQRQSDEGDSHSNSVEGVFERGLGLEVVVVEDVATAVVVVDHE